MHFWCNGRSPKVRFSIFSFTLIISNQNFVIVKQTFLEAIISTLQTNGWERREFKQLPTHQNAANKIFFR